MTEYLEEYRGYQLKIWTENNLFGGEYQVGEINRIWHECSLGNLLALFHEAVDSL